MRIIPVGDRYAIVDDEVFDELSTMRWHLHLGYAATCLPRNGQRQRRRLMHHCVCPPTGGMEVDHINGNRLDNRACNLRVVTRQQNTWNRKRNHHKVLPKGVFYHKHKNKLYATIKQDGRIRHLGYFESQEQAHAAYCAEASRLRGQFARFD